MSKMSDIHADLTTFQGQNLNSTGYYGYPQTKGTLYDAEIHVVVEVDMFDDLCHNRIACLSLEEAQNTINIYEAQESFNTGRYSYFIDTIPIRT